MRGLLWTAMLLCMALVPAHAGEEAWVETIYEPAGPASRLALHDVDGDGRLDLLDISPWGIRCHTMGSDGRFAQDVSTSLRWPSAATGWDLIDLDGDGATEVVLLVDGSKVIVHRPGREGTWGEGTTVLEGAGGWLPRGVRRMRVARDVNGDGRTDFVLPAMDRYLIYTQDEAGVFQGPLSVRFDARIHLEFGDPDRLDGRFTQDVVIPWFELTDVDGDGLPDLVTESGDEVMVHLASPDLPAEPSWRLDLASLREAAQGGGRINLDDLFSNIDPEAHWKVADLDGAAPLDLVLQVGGRIRLFLGGSRGPRLERPDQVLKLSGNVLWFVLRDTDGDGLADLQLVRAERISLGTVLRWLVLAGSLDFEVFTYRNLGGSFSRKPSATKTVSLRIPAILSFVDEVQEMEDEYEQRRAIPAGLASLDGDGVFNDVVDLRGGTVVFYRDRAPADLGTDVEQRLSSMENVDQLLEASVLQDLDQLQEGGTRSVGVEDLYALMETPGYLMRQATKKLRPDQRFAIPFSPVTSPPLDLPGEMLGDFQLALRDLNGDGVSDVVVTGSDGPNERSVQFLVSR